METFITIAIIMTLAAISNWIAKRREAAEQAEHSEHENLWEEEPPRHPAQTTAPPPRQGPPPPIPAPRSSWEDELRRILQGEPAEQPPKPPPVVAREQPVPAPPRPPAQAPPLESKKRPVSTKVIAEQAAAKFQKAQEALGERAQQMTEQTAVSKPRVRRTIPTATTRPKVSSEAAAVMGMLRKPHTARRAFLASVVFAPPKAFEDSPPPGLAR